jgi:hypothetical protein
VQVEFEAEVEAEVEPEVEPEAVAGRPDRASRT